MILIYIYIYIYIYKIPPSFRDLFELLDEQTVREHLDVTAFWPALLCEINRQKHIFTLFMFVCLHFFIRVVIVAFPFR